MVAPDGTVYVPNRACGGKQGVVASENNGITWSVRPVPDSLQGANDPGVGIGANGSVYFGYQNGDGLADVAVSHDKGLTWTPSKDIGAAFGIKNSSFPRVVAGDDDRAAFAFLGTPTAGPFQDSNFQGEWHLYVAHTYDSGQTWTTIDATPADPVQRGCIWMQGGSNPCRNLLDFMGETVDKEGRVLVGYADGCIGCTDPFGSRAKKATIARQVNGRRLFAAYDPTGSPSPTPTPSPTATPTPQQGSNVLHFHGNPTDDSGFTGFGMVDVVANGGPFLDTRDTLGTTAPAHWDVPDPAVNGSADQNIYDPSWIWLLNSPTTLNGDMTIKWWASCSACTTAAGLNADWNIRLWADGVKVFEQRVANVTPDLPNVPQLLQTTVTVPTITAGSKFVLHVDPVFVDDQVNTHIYYDSQSSCPGASGNQPCDSRVIMPIVGLNPTPTPTPNGSPTPTPTPTATPTPTPTPSGCPANDPTSFSIHMSPTGMGDGWGEPSIGVNWKTEQVFNGTPNGGTVMTYGGFGTYALRVTFDDTAPASPVANWEKTPTLPLASQPRAAGDPILFTDRETGRTLISQLLGGTPTSTTDITDDDGRTFSVSQGSGIVSGVDHQTIGGGPFAAPLTGGVTYKNAIYYCSQDVADAVCSLSVDGGTTFGPAVPIFTRADCNGLHGHIKVSPKDGTAYVPNKACGGTDPTFHVDGHQAVAVSENNGVTWAVRQVTTSTPVAQSLTGDSTQAWDPSVGVATDGTLYFGYQNVDGHAHVAVSHDKGLTWVNDRDVGAQAGVQNTSFPEMVAGDSDRAAYAFFGTTTGGTDYDQASFQGAWYLYIGTTYDGGQTWTTINATPGDPIQRGGICGGGTCRNLLDFFDATIDKQGRVLVGYEDGCITAGCIQGTAGNNFTSKNAIARQLTGKRMFAAYDACGNPTPTPTPTATPTPTPTPIQITPIYQKGGITFSPNVTVRASVSGRDGEPSLRVDKLGNAYVAGIRGVPAGVDLWYFDLNPNSSTYDPLMRNPIYRGQPDQFSPDEAVEVGADGGGDVDLAVGFDEASPGNPPYLAFSSLALANVSTARSTDRGATFVKNPLGNATGGVPVDDRQWMEFYGKDSVYLLYRTVDPVIAYVQRSNDGGLTYGPAREVGSVGQVGGISVDQNDGTVYVSGSNGVVAVGTPLAPGLEPLTYTIHNVEASGNAHIFFTVKAAKDGTAYAGYSNGQTVFIRYSKDKGNTWSPAVRVSDGPETATSILPWMETGPTPGSIGVVWYGTTATSNNDNADWKVFFAQSLNTTDANPVFRQVALSDHFVHGSNISEAGLPITPGNAPNRNLLDYFQIGFDPTGAAVVAYTDDHNDFDGHTYVARQISGKGAKGTDIPTPVEGSALPPRTTRDPNCSTGKRSARYSFGEVHD